MSEDEELARLLRLEKERCHAVVEMVRAECERQIAESEQQLAEHHASLRLIRTSWASLALLWAGGALAVVTGHVHVAMVCIAGMGVWLVLSSWRR